MMSDRTLLCFNMKGKGHEEASETQQQARCLVQMGALEPLPIQTRQAGSPASFPGRLLHCTLHAEQGVITTCLVEQMGENIIRYCTTVALRRSPSASSSSVWPRGTSVEEEMGGKLPTAPSCTSAEICGMMTTTGGILVLPAGCWVWIRITSSSPFGIFRAVPWPFCVCRGLQQH